jgi:hypothetical protein
MKICLVLFFFITGFSVTPAQVPPKADLKNVGITARSFVTDLAKTHSVSSLLQKWFIKKFEITAIPDVDGAVWDESAKKLPPKKRRRLFLAYWNWLYISTVIHQSKPKSLECYDESPECKEKDVKNLLRVFSVADVSLFQKFSGSYKREENESDMFASVPFMESMINKAQPVLQKQNLEQTKEFRYWIKIFEGDRFLGYAVETEIMIESVKDKHNRKIIKKGEIIYSVETPLLIRVDFVKRGKSFKIFNLGVGDGD